MQKKLLKFAQDAQDDTLALSIGYHAAGVRNQNLDDIDPTFVIWVWQTTGSQLYCKAAIRMLKAYFLDPKHRTEESTTVLLHKTASTMDTSLMELLLKISDADPETRDQSGRSLLSFASGNGGTATVESLLAINRVQPDSKDNDGRTLLS